MNRLPAIIAACALLAACGPIESSIVSRQVITVKVVKVDPPKRMYVDLQEPDGTVHKRVYVSKRCSNYAEKLKRDPYIEVTKTVKRYNDDSQRTSFDGLYSKLCT